MYHTSFNFVISLTILIEISFDFIYYDTLWLYFLSKKIEVILTVELRVFYSSYNLLKQESTKHILFFGIFRKS